MSTIQVLLAVAQGMFIGALISYIREGVPRWVYWALGLNAVLLCATFILTGSTALAVCSAAIAGAAFAFLSNPPEATA